MAVAAFTAVVGFAQSRKAKRGAGAATALSAKQQKQTTAETIRRQEYTHERDISDIEAEIAASGVSSTGAGLRDAGKRTTTSFDADIATLEGEIEEYKTETADLSTASREDEDQDNMQTMMVSTRRNPDLIDKNERLESLKKQQQQELDLPWNPEGGMFAEYLMERERVQISEIEWMRRTGLSNLESIYAEGRSAQATARAAGAGYLSKLVGAAANWWESSQTPTNTTTTAQTAEV